MDGTGDDDSTAETAVVAIKQFKGLADMEDEHTRNYVRLTQDREADLARSLIHPNIVRCLGTLTATEARGRGGASSPGGDGGGGADGVAFLVFEHVPGTLLDLIQERPGGLSLSEVCGLWLSFVFLDYLRNMIWLFLLQQRQQRCLSVAKPGRTCRSPTDSVPGHVIHNTTLPKRQQVEQKKTRRTRRTRYNPRRRFLFFSHESPQLVL